MTSRQDVYSAIDEERAYQDAKWNPAEDHQHSVAEWLLYIEDYVNEAKRVLSRQPDPIALDFGRHTLRKIAAMGVAALEQNGVLRRSLEGGRAIGAIAS